MGLITSEKLESSTAPQYFFYPIQDMPACASEKIEKSDESLNITYLWTLRLVLRLSPWLFQTIVGIHYFAYEWLYSKDYFESRKRQWKL